MYNRFAKTQKIINNSDEYAEYFRQRNMKDLKQYSTFNFSNLKNIENQNLEVILHRFLPNEKLYNISQKYYNSPEFSWLICYTNRFPNELSISPNTLLKIYLPIESVLELL